jgi:hypothetical protein
MLIIIFQAQCRTVKIALFTITLFISSPSLFVLYLVFHVIDILYHFISVLWFPFAYFVKFSKIYLFSIAYKKCRKKTTEILLCIPVRNPDARYQNTLFIYYEFTFILHMFFFSIKKGSPFIIDHYP